MLNVGDDVKIIKKTYKDLPEIGTIGKIVDINGKLEYPGYPYGVEVNGYVYRYCDSELEVISEGE